MCLAISFLTDGPKLTFGSQPVFLVSTALTTLRLPELARQFGYFVMI